MSFRGAWGRWQDRAMGIRFLIAACVFAAALVLAGAPALGHHRDGHTGGPGREAEAREEGDSHRDEKGKAEEPQGTGVAASLAVITGGVVLIAGVGLRPRRS